MRVVLALALVAMLAIFLSPQPAHADPDPGWEAGYSYRKKITINADNVSGSEDLSNFPMLISITDNDLRTTADGGHVTNADGYDIMFTSSDGTTDLDHETEKYTSSADNATYIAWVRIPTLDYNDDTIIYMYYGNSSISTDPSKTTTWDSNYKLVQHLNESCNTANCTKDSTSNNNDGTPYSGENITSLYTSSGKMNGADDFDGSDDNENCPTFLNSYANSCACR